MGRIGKRIVAIYTDGNLMQIKSIWGNKHDRIQNHRIPEWRIPNYNCDGESPPSKILAVVSISAGYAEGDMEDYIH